MHHALDRYIRRTESAKEQRTASQARIEAAHAETQAIVKTGKCPLCGSKVKRNLALSGWWMCEQRGAEGFRARATDPACEWQGFTDF